MQNLNQQNSQLYICIPQLNTLGHPSDFGLRRSHAGHHPQVLPLQRPSSSLAPDQNCHANGCFTGFLDLILKQITEISVGKETLSGYRVPGLHYRLVFQATFTRTQPEQVPTTYEQDFGGSTGIRHSGMRHVRKPTLALESCRFSTGAPRSTCVLPS